MRIRRKYLVNKYPAAFDAMSILARDAGGDIRIPVPEFNGSFTLSPKCAPFQRCIGQNVRSKNLEAGDATAQIRHQVSRTLDWIRMKSPESLKCGANIFDQFAICQLYGIL
jgi:hypothetical protein